MKLFTRLINEGVFIFWSSDEGATAFNLKISAIVGGERINIVSITPKSGENYYSFDRIGSGEYEIAVDAYKGDKLYQTEVKNVKIISSVQKSEENVSEIIDSIATIKSQLVNIKQNVAEIKAATTDGQKISEIRKEADYYYLRVVLGI